MSFFNRDLILCLLFIIGIWSFIAGQFIISTIAFGIAAIYSNIAIGARQNL